MHVGHQRLAFRQHRQLEVVRENSVYALCAKRSAAAQAKGQAVEGAGAAAHFVHQHQAARSVALLQNIGGFAHFYA